MKTKKLRILIFLVVIGLFISGCGLGNLSDKKFAESASVVCSNLKANVAELSILNFELKSGFYRKAANELADLEMTEESAPNGFRLRSGLTELADALDMFGTAFTEAFAKTGITGLYIVNTTESGNIYAHASGNLSSIRKLDMEKSLLTNLTTIEELISEAAIALDLKDCSIEN